MCTDLKLSRALAFNVSVLPQALLHNEIIQLVALSQVQQVLTGALPERQVNLSCFKEELDDTLCDLLLFNVARKDGAEKRCFPLQSLHVQNIKTVLVLLEVTD